MAIKQKRDPLADLSASPYEFTIDGEDAYVQWELGVVNAMTAIGFQLEEYEEPIDALRCVMHRNETKGNGLALFLFVVDNVEAYMATVALWRGIQKYVSLQITNKKQIMEQIYKQFVEVIEANKAKQSITELIQNLPTQVTHQQAQVEQSPEEEPEPPGRFSTSMKGPGG